MHLSVFIERNHEAISLLLRELLNARQYFADLVRVIVGAAGFHSLDICI